MELNEFKRKLNNKEFVYGVFMKTSDPMFVEIDALAGFDYAILDTEHGPTDIEHQQNNIRACEAKGILPIVRVPVIDENVIGKALDIGAKGIQVSNVKTKEDVERIIKYAKFYPYGERGVCRFVRAAGYSSVDRNEYFEDSKDNLIIIQLEGTEAIKNLNSILEIDGYDIIFIGPYDLSQSLGVPGQVKNPIVLKAMMEIVEAAKTKGKTIGTFVDDFELAEKWKSLGVQYISYSTDSGLYFEKARDTYNKLNLAGVKTSKAQVLDCTLRDGGYVNNWKFGQKNIKNIISNLYEANIDYIECGFVNENVETTTGISKFHSIDDVNKILPKKIKTNYAIMINYGSVDINDVPNYNGNGVNCIRVAFHKKDLSSALDYCKVIKEKGYKVFVQAMVSLSYTESEFLYLINKCNEFKPYSMYIVDSFGSMNKKEALYYFKLAERNLSNDILLGFHAHNNMQLAFANAMSLLENSNRKFIIDSSVHGMGRGAGNLNTEILINYLNQEYLGNYNITPILDINDSIIEKIYSLTPWGYSLPNYLSAKHNCHPNYAKHLMEKNNLTVDDINSIFDMLDVDQKVEYDQKYIEELYLSYLESKDSINDDFDKAKNIFYNKKIAMICPGKSSILNSSQIIEDKKNGYLLVSINHNYSKTEVDYIFVGNKKRMKELELSSQNKIIATSNIPSNECMIKINYSSLLNENQFVSDNSGLMFLKLMTKCNPLEVKIYGMDGFTYNASENYSSDEMILANQKETVDNLNFGMNVEFKKLNDKLNLIKIDK